MISGKIDELLGIGDAIVEGRSVLILLNRKDVFKVPIVASQAARIGRVAKRRSITATRRQREAKQTNRRQSCNPTQSKIDKRSQAQRGSSIDDRKTNLWSNAKGSTLL